MSSSLARLLLTILLPISQSGQVRRYRDCSNDNIIQAREGERLNLTGTVEPTKTCYISFQHQNGSKSCFASSNGAQESCDDLSRDYNNKNINNNSSYYTECFASIVFAKEAHVGRYTVHEIGTTFSTSCNLVLRVPSNSNVNLSPLMIGLFLLILGFVSGIFLTSFFCVCARQFVTEEKCKEVANLLTQQQHSKQNLQKQQQKLLLMQKHTEQF